MLEAGVSGKLPEVINNSRRIFYYQGDSTMVEETCRTSADQEHVVARLRKMVQDIEPLLQMLRVLENFHGRLQNIVACRARRKTAESKRRAHRKTAESASPLQSYSRSQID